MSDASDSCAGTDPSEVSSSMDFWYNLYTGKKLADFEDESKQVASGSDLEADWGYVLGSLSKGKKAKRRKKDYGSCSTGNSTTGNSTSDLSEALSSISAALSLSSSDSDRRDGSGTTDGRGETGKTGEDEVTFTIYAQMYLFDIDVCFFSELVYLSFYSGLKILVAGLVRMGNLSNCWSGNGTKVCFFPCTSDCCPKGSTRGRWIFANRLSLS
ncbi:hypothetical protein LINPERPRIM_LOCUS19248 [Linum perenne]